MCRINALECSESVRAAAAFLVGRNIAHEPTICARCTDVQVMGLAMIAAMTGHDEFVGQIQEVLKAPRLRLVKPTEETDG